jgi:hypothetical protein
MLMFKGHNPGMGLEQEKNEGFCQLKLYSDLLSKCQEAAYSPLNLPIEQHVIDIYAGKQPYFDATDV